jgi:LPS export ABC transporter protein LptC
LIYRLLILLGLVLIGVAVWVTLSPRQAEPVTAQSSGPARPDSGYAATDASMVETGADGLPMYTLQAHRIQQDPDTNIIKLSTVHMAFRDSSGSEWQTPADAAQARQDTAQIDLNGSIDLSGTPSGNDKPVHVLTDRLHINTHTDVITAPSVTLTWGAIVIHAPSLVLNTKTHNVRLESELHGHLAP